MGEHQAITALEWNISREAQDELAASHQNLARAYDEGFLDDLITPYKGLTQITICVQILPLKSWQNLSQCLVNATRTQP